VPQNENCLACGEQCTLGKRQNNGASHAPNCRNKVNIRGLLPLNVATKVRPHPVPSLEGAGSSTSSPNFTFLCTAVRKFLTIVPFRYLSVRPDVYLKGRAWPHPPANMNLVCDPFRKLLTNKVYSYCISACHIN
jgi:hypothetical protein